MTISPDDPFLHSIHLNDFGEYLRLHGWQQTDQPNGKTVLFAGPKSDSGEPIELVLPRSSEYRDYWFRVADAVNALSEIEDKSPQSIAQAIAFFNYDVLRVRILETDGRSSIALKLAVDQVRSLKKLIVYGACSEQEPRPYFPTQLRSATVVSDRYEFGHTFPGSFGFTIAALVRAPTEFVFQMPLSDDFGQPVSLSPIERRIMERISRGLADTQAATKSQNSDILLEHYASGFNSNMCDAVVTMSEGKRVAIEYDVDWSPKLQPSDDVTQADKFRLNERSYESLAYVSKQLKRVIPKHELIRGYVKGLTSKGAPLGVASERTVLIRWTNRPDGRPVDLVVTLDRDEYLEAYRSHLDYKTVEVTGIPHRVANIWRLAEPSDFKIVG